MPGSVYEEAYLEVDGEVAGEMSIKKKKKKKKKEGTMISKQQLSETG